MDTKNREDEGKAAEVAKGRSRVKRNPAQWAEAIEAQRHTGLTIEAFCRQERISKSSFTRWRGHLAGRCGSWARGISRHADSWRSVN